MSFGCGRARSRSRRGWRQWRRWLALAFVTEMMALTAAGQPREISKSNLLLSEYQKQGWQVEDGLPANNVRCIAQRADGSLIIASSSGISIFDGLHFSRQPIDGSSTRDPDGDNEAVNAVLPVGLDEMWIGTDGRGVLHQSVSGTVNISEAAGRYHERIRNLYRDAQGVIWIATQNGIERYAHGRLELVDGGGMIEGSIVAPFAEDGTGGMLFVTSSGLYRWRNGKVSAHSLHKVPGEQAIALYRDVHGHLWVGTTKHVVELVLQKAAATRNPSEEFDEVVKSTVPDAISTMIGDNAGNLWIGTRRAGLWRLSPEGRKLGASSGICATRMK